MRAPSAGRLRGLTLVEVCAVLAIAAILLGGAAPSVEGLWLRWQLEGRASELATDLHWIRSEAVARNRTMRISFQDDVAGTCYVIHDGAEGACVCTGQGAAHCADAEVQASKAVFLPASGPVRLQSNVESMVYSPTHGTTSPAATLTLTDRRQRAISHVVNIMGRILSCSPEGTVAGYRPC
jgi:type IV fimbrial biogenesis protein FimT